MTSYFNFWCVLNFNILGLNFCVKIDSFTSLLNTSKRVWPVFSPHFLIFVNLIRPTFFRCPTPRMPQLLKSWSTKKNYKKILNFQWYVPHFLWEIRGEYVMGFYKRIDDLKTKKIRLEQVGNSNQTVITQTVS